MSTAWTKGDRKARRQLEKALQSDETDNVTRFALVRLLANKADPVTAEVNHSTFCIVYYCCGLVPPLYDAAVHSVEEKSSVTCHDPVADMWLNR